MAYYNQGDIYANKEQYNEAIANYTKAIEINPKYASAYCNIGYIYSLQNNVSEALKYLELAFQNGYDNFAWINKDTNWVTLDHRTNLRC